MRPPRFSLIPTEKSARRTRQRPRPTCSSSRPPETSYTREPSIASLLPTPQTFQRPTTISSTPGKRSRKARPSPRPKPIHTDVASSTQTNSFPTQEAHASFPPRALRLFLHRNNLTTEGDSQASRPLRRQQATLCRLLTRRLRRFALHYGERHRLNRQVHQRRILTGRRLHEPISHRVVAAWHVDHCGR